MSGNKGNTAVSKVTKTAEKAVSKVGQFAITKPVTVLYIVVGGIALFGIYKAVKRIQDTFDPDLNDTVEGTGCSMVGATITDQQAINFASQLLDAMNVGRGSLFMSGTDEKTISQVFDKLKTPADFCKIFAVFGLKEYDGYESPPDNFIANITVYEKRDLVYWLKSEINSFWDGSLYKKVKKVVEQAGFAF